MGKLATILAVKDEALSFVPTGFTKIGALGGMPDWPAAYAGPRPDLENDPTFRQLIPYVIVTIGDKAVTYLREKTGNEERLHGKASIGVGGHIDLEDFAADSNGAIDVIGTVITSAARELSEEIGIGEELAMGMRIVGVVKACDTPTDVVHFGIVLKLALPEDTALTFEDTMGNVKLLTAKEILASDLELETWSKLVIALI